MPLDRCPELFSNINLPIKVILHKQSYRVHDVAKFAKRTMHDAQQHRISVCLQFSPSTLIEDRHPVCPHLTPAFPSFLFAKI